MDDKPDQKQGQNEVAARDVDDRAADVQAETGDEKSADNEADGGAGDDDHDRMPAAVLERLEDLSGPEPGLLAEPTDDDGGHDAEECGLDRGEPVDQHTDQHQKRQEEMPASQEHLDQVRLLVPGQLDETGLVRLQVHEPDQASEVQQGGIRFATATVR